MKKIVLILAVLLCSIAFSASVLAENDEVAAASSEKTVRSWLCPDESLV